MSQLEEYYEKALRPTLLPFGLPGPSFDKLPESVKQKIKDAFFWQTLANDTEKFMVDVLGVKRTVK